MQRKTPLDITQKKKTGIGGINLCTRIPHEPYDRSCTAGGLESVTVLRRHRNNRDIIIIIIIIIVPKASPIPRARKKNG